MVVKEKKAVKVNRTQLIRKILEAKPDTKTAEIMKEVVCSAGLVGQVRRILKGEASLAIPGALRKPKTSIAASLPCCEVLP